MSHKAIRLPRKGKFCSTELIIGNTDNCYDLTLGCPLCNGDGSCVHISKVTVDQGTRHFVEITDDGLHVTQPPKEVPQRGSIVKINFFCEEGHRFAVEFQFHKGAVFVRGKDFADVGLDDDGVPIWDTELWRD